MGDPSWYASVTQTFSSKREETSGALPEATTEFSIGSAFDKAGVAITGTFNNIKTSLGFGDAPAGAEPAKKSTATASFAGDKKDWRVKLSLPREWESYPIFLYSLGITGGLVFPFTPTVMVSNSASYNTLKPIHSNYSFYAYQNSQPESITISSPFSVQDKYDAEYWTGALHYLRSATKMAYGETSNAGAPPVIVRLNGYGNHVFPNVPVVVTTFSVDLPADVDYIYVEPLSTAQGTYVPTRSTISVTVTPVYSRSSIEQFSFDKFANGGYLSDDKGYI